VAAQLSGGGAELANAELANIDGVGRCRQLKCLVHPLARQQGELIIRYQAWLQTFQWLSINDKDANRSVPIGNASPSARPNESTTLNQPRPINNSAPRRTFLALH
jgi:hypothetical protein